jgi:FixJ family two-component response regulator
MASTGRFVVVVDDDVSVARAISRLLRAAGMTVDTFTTAPTALPGSPRSPAICPRA